MTPREQRPDWTEEVRDRDSEARSRFLEAYLDLVKYQALRICTRLPSSVELDDLMHDGVLGLMDAVERFDPGRGVRFNTYAETRVRGAIMDGLRRKDWRPRSLRQRKRDLDAALDELASVHQRAATEEEIAGKLDVSLSEYHSILADLNLGTQLSLDDLPNGGDAALATPSAPYRDIERSETLQLVAREITALPERERLVLELYHGKGLNMKEVGAVLGVTESRVCQLHSQATARIRVGVNRQQGAPVLAGNQETRK